VSKVGRNKTLLEYICVMKGEKMTKKIKLTKLQLRILRHAFDSHSANLDNCEEEEDYNMYFYCSSKVVHKVLDRIAKKL